MLAVVDGKGSGEAPRILGRVRLRANTLTLGSGFAAPGSTAMWSRVVHPPRHGALLALSMVGHRP